MSIEAIVLLCGVITLLVVVAMLLHRRGPQSPRDVESPAGVDAQSEAQEEEPVVDQGEVVLVPLPTRRDEALVLGSSQAMDALERSGLTNRTIFGSHSPLPQIIRQVMALGTGRINQTAQTGIDSGRIVALSKETMEQLRRHGPAYDKTGRILGVLRGGRGQMKHIMRLDRSAASAMVASNAATLAMTASLSAQLGHIEHQLTEIRETLKDLVRDNDRKRLAKIVGASEVLQSVAEDMRRRGEITEADWNRVAAVNLAVTTATVEAQYKFDEIQGTLSGHRNRAERANAIDRLIAKERLEYWLAVRVESELAQARWELLHLCWEQSRHPESAGQLAEQVRGSIVTRREGLAQLASLLRVLADPEARIRFDSLRLLSWHRLKRQQRLVDRLLRHHGGVFAKPDDDAFFITPPDAASDQEVPTTNPPTSAD